MDWDSLNLLSERVIGAVYEVANGLGAGFLEKVYERALMRELALRGMRVAAQAPFSVSYKGQSVGDYFADLLVEDALIVELKCVECLGREAYGSVSELLASFGIRALSACELSTGSGGNTTRGQFENLLIR